MATKKQNEEKAITEKEVKPTKSKKTETKSLKSNKKPPANKTVAKATPKATAEKKVEKIEAFPVKDTEPKASKATDRGVIVLGIGMLLMGLLLLGGRLLQIPFGDFLWPFIFIVPGALIFFSAITSDSSSGEGVAIVGGILGMLGFVFFMQTVTRFWASWAYAWALVAPTSIGLSQMAYGNIKKKDAIVDTGWKFTKIGLIILTAGFIFFELILGISGFGLGLPVFPMILIFFGGFLLIRSIIRTK